MILDGWGIGKHDKGDVILQDSNSLSRLLTAVSAHSTLQTCGEDVGLPNGQMGNYRGRSPQHRCRSCGISGPR